MRTVEQQLASLGTALEERYGPTTPPHTVPDGTARRPTPPLVGAVALVTAVAIVVIGIAVALTRSTDEAPIAPTTTTVVTSTTVAALAPIAGGGPELEFDIIPSPVGAEPALLNQGVWFRDALYAIGQRDHRLYRTVDGRDWEIVAGYDAIEGPRNGFLFTDGETLVNVSQSGEPFPGYGSGGCTGVGPDSIPPSNLLQMNTSTDGSTWDVASITFGELAPGLDCIEVFTAGHAIGPAGILVVRDVAGQPMAMVLDQAGRLTVVDDPWPTSAEAVTGVVAVDDGFLVTVDESTVFFTEDGSEWEEVDRFTQNGSLDTWQGGVVSREIHRTPVRVTDSGVQSRDGSVPLLPGDATRFLELTFTEFGIVGLPTLGRQSGNQIEMLWSDGSTWARWDLPAEDFVIEGYTLVGVGPDFVVLNVLFDGGLAVASFGGT